MIDKLKDFMRKKHNYILNEYKICSSEVRKSKAVSWPIYVLVILVVGYGLQVVNIIPKVLSLTIVAVLGTFLVIFQVTTLIRKNKTEALVITPKYLIKCFGSNIFTVINFDEIKRFKVSDTDGIIISDRRNEIAMSPVAYRTDLESIVDILESKGKTFDKSRDYMKRQVEIHIINNRVVLQEIEQETSSTEKLVGEYYEEFKMLTPGFIHDVIFLNSIVEDVFTTNNNLIINLDKIEVKEGHPENTGFESLVANDCIIIFEDVDIKYVYIKKVRERNSKEEALPNEVETIVNNIEKGVIADWKYRKKGIDLHLAVGTNFLKVSFDYKEVIIGWKKFE